MPQLEKYAFLLIPNGTYILHTQAPLVVGRVWMYKDIQQLNEFLDKINPMEIVKIHGYNIAITTWAFLDNKLVYHSNFDEELKKAMHGMADFFVESKIKASPIYYNKFLT
jgi:hypothetical protein